MRPLFGKCRKFHKLQVSDDPRDTLFLKRHAADCDACRLTVEADRNIAAAAAAWREESPLPPESLAARIEATLAHESLRPARFDDRHAGRRIAPAWFSLRTAGAAVAALLVVVSAGVAWRIYAPGSAETKLASAIRAADRSQQDYARAIAELENAASTVLARAADPSFDSRSAAILVTYRDRLAHLDTVITEVQGFLDANPGHTGGHTVLLAAYREKADVLRSVIALPDGGTS